ncbi:unnamed protein product, partial [Meganyctiphanes norvegica]
ELVEAKYTIKPCLEEQLQELQKAKYALEVKQTELQDMLTRLEEAKTMEAEEKAKLEEEIRIKQEEILRVQDEVQMRDKEAKHLQELKAELEPARKSDALSELDQIYEIEVEEENFGNTKRRIDTFENW